MLEEYFNAHQDAFEGKVDIGFSGAKFDHPDARVMVG